MKKNKRVFTIIFSFFLFFFLVFYHQAAYASPYGCGNYSGNTYGNGQSCGTSGSSGSSSGGESGSISCTDQAPGSAPNLYEVDTTGSTATIYFAPAAKPYTYYYVSFGDGTNDEGYGAQFALSQTSGAIRYHIYYLKNNAVYTFKVRAGNGCMAGPWSNTLSARTGGGNSKTIARYYPKKQATNTFFASNTFKGISSSIKKYLFPFLPATGKGNTGSPKQVPAPKQSSASKKTCFFFICW